MNADRDAITVCLSRDCPLLTVIVLKAYVRHLHQLELCCQRVLDSQSCHSTAESIGSCFNGPLCKLSNHERKLLRKSGLLASRSVAHSDVVAAVPVHGTISKTQFRHLLFLRQDLASVTKRPYSNSLS